MSFLLLLFLTGTSNTMLFVGNSYTFANEGLWSITGNLYQSVTGDTLVTLHHTMGGASFQDHWNSADLHEIIQTQDIDIVIFQEQSCMPVVDPSRTYQYGDSLALLCVSRGIQPAFMMTWARKNDQLMLTGLQAAYSRMGYEHMCPVAPCGIGFQLSRQRFALLDPYAEDGAHPSLVGSYLSACIICSSVLGADILQPEAWFPEGISSMTGEILRGIAIEACSTYQQPMEVTGEI